MEEGILGYVLKFFYLHTLFIETRTSGSVMIWQLLKNACEENAETAEALILA